MMIDPVELLSDTLESGTLIALWSVLAERRPKLWEYPIALLLLTAASTGLSMSPFVPILLLNFALIALCFRLGFFSVPLRSSLPQSLFAYSVLLFLRTILYGLMPFALSKVRLISHGILFPVALLLAFLSYRFHWGGLYRQNRRQVVVFLVAFFLPEMLWLQFGSIDLDRWLWNLYYMPDFMVTSLEHIRLQLLILLFYAVVLALIMLAWRHHTLNRQISRTKAHLATVNEYLADVRQRSHDFNRHIRYLRHTVDAGRELGEVVSAVDSYCDELMEEGNADDALLYLDDPVFRALLYGRQTQARRQNIQFFFSASALLPDFPLKDYQTVEVFDNLIDNAFDCVTELPEKDRWIRVTLEASAEGDGRTRHFMSIENPCGQADLSAMLGQEGYTSKSGDHWGIGLKKAERIISQTGGQLLLSRHNGVFAVKVVYLLPLETEK